MRDNSNVLYELDMIKFMAPTEKINSFACLGRCKIYSNAGSFSIEAFGIMYKIKSMSTLLLQAYLEYEVCLRKDNNFCFTYNS